MHVNWVNVERKIPMPSSPGHAVSHVQFIFVFSVLPTYGFCFLIFSGYGFDLGELGYLYI